MINKEKVINGLKEVSGFLFKEYAKAQAEEASLYYDRFLVVDNAIELLKEQEAVEPKKENDGNPEPWTTWWYVCGDCGQPIDKMDRYCRRCGKQVKWE